MEQILNKLSEIEITAQRIMQDADRTKAALSAEMEQQCKDLDLELEQETSRYEAVINASVSRLRPVTMAAGTTILGVAPLLTHVFFDSMAATIMFGLIGATLLTLLAVPVLYAILFQLPVSPENSVK